jgi:hypothetical protein
MKFTKHHNGWNFTIGGVNGNAFMIKLRFICNTKTLRLLLDLNHERLINLFGFNHREFAIGGIR